MRLELLKNVPVPMPVMPAGSVTADRLEHPANAQSPVMASDPHPERSASVSPVPLKARSPMCVSPAGKFIDASDTQPLKADEPIFFMD